MGLASSLWHTDEAVARRAIRKVKRIARHERIFSLARADSETAANAAGALTSLRRSCAG